MARAAITGQQVRDLMTFHAVTVAPDDTVKEALDLLVANNVAALPVVDGANRCVGVISATDLLGLAQERGEDLEAFNAAEGLSRELLVEHLERADFSDLVVKEAMTPTPIGAWACEGGLEGGDSPNRKIDDPAGKGYDLDQGGPTPFRIATASTHHRRDEPSIADGNLTGLLCRWCCTGHGDHSRVDDAPVR